MALSRINSPEQLDALQEKLASEYDESKPVIVVSCGTCGIARGAQAVVRALKRALTKLAAAERISLRITGCHGFCEREPTVIVEPEDTFYECVQPKDAEEIASAVLKGQVVQRLLHRNPDSDQPVRTEAEVFFYRKQNRLLMGMLRKLRPGEIEDYIRLGGYQALKKVLTQMTPEQVIEEVKRANLRGRGGGGFPAGIKWEATRRSPDPVKYVIVNADEGDPGAYMDRSLLEGNPHQVLEGLVIGAYAIGARQGFVYVRQEYPQALENILRAINQARRLGLLGENILGSNFSFDVEVHRGAGAFVSGESSALVTAIEGRVGEPRPKYIRLARSGLWGKPTNLNNVETWANVPLIITRGASWFTGIGTEGSKGTKIFSLVGKVKNTGLVEVPMGTTLREIIFDIGGGMRAGKKFKAVQTGGPSGGCLPESHLDLPVDFDELTKAGSMIGSGGMIVMDEDACLVDVARYFVQFLAYESCGKCIPCREGIRQMRTILNRICEGKGREGDLEVLAELGLLMSNASLCGLGTTASNPVLSTIKYFREEYETHIKERRCPAGVCKALTAYYIDPEKCRACGLCKKHCPATAIKGARKKVHQIIQQKCTKCGTCSEVCPPKFRAVLKLAPAEVPVTPAELLPVTEIAN
jgi:NADH-quinone oxidoreductase subunit F